MGVKRNGHDMQYECARKLYEFILAFNNSINQFVIFVLVGSVLAQEFRLSAVCGNSESSVQAFEQDYFDWLGMDA